MKISGLLPRKKLRATVARRSLRASAKTYDDISEPNMKLSRALLIVLVLHVVAVSGIVAFNAIKTRQDSFVKAAPGKRVEDVRQRTDSPARTEQKGQDGRGPRNSVAAADSIGPPSSAAKAVANESKPTESGKVYIVVKGDNPVTIARKLKVSYDELIELNHIDDPRKLQIGQKLLIPKPAKGKKTDE